MFVARAAQPPAGSFVPENVVRSIVQGHPVPLSRGGRFGAVQASREVAAAESGAIRFTVLILMTAILLQRFAVPLGDQFMSVVGPLGLLYAAIGLARGHLTLDPGRFAAFLAFCVLAALGSTYALAVKAPWMPEVSWTSLLHFLVLTSFAAFAFRTPVPEERFFAAVQSCLAFVAAAGLIQFVAQFAGLGLFTFAGLLPDAILLPGYNTAIPLDFAGLFKSNGFFLVEPSVFSQMMAIALIIEVLYFRRTRYLVLFPAGLVASVSGTGWVVLIAFLLQAVLAMGLQGIVIATATVIAGGAALGGLAYALPEVFEGLIGRTDEFNPMGTSGHERFVTPWWLLDFAYGEAPYAAFTGLGAGTAERLPVTYGFAMNVPVKLMIEYGVPALILYVSLFLIARRTRRQTALVLPVLALMLFTGGYQQFPPVLFPALLLVAVARLRETEPAARR